ncbi:pyridoxamine 5'-phosphate oxidase family protein [Occallatibacter riparius]|uniref:Pyridoxamine 5'-phosphate oxidase family protein n=1 Tax=Occallatibacter riparius TaxID=1002689 RepID=A0A9J7BRZ1_9BACT|nr:pyridoxamine 5'-phosphate oxidase family protein [Occallatibacter riparius]UWZ85337.1 pyridoxamine 5'-phosphate oxidase family protein [Occallatibacter riparius]
MAKHFPSMEPTHREFISRQRIFFTASAARTGRVNVSPKDSAALRVLSPNQVVYLDMTGSGNETAAHLLADGRLTLMFCAFEGAPLILRLYGRGRVLARGSAEYGELLGTEFGNEERPGTRQMFVLDVESVQTSCGYGVPLFDYVEDRDTLTRWAAAKGDVGLREYWHAKNMASIDGFPTGLVDSESPVS